MSLQIKQMPLWPGGEGGLGVGGMAGRSRLPWNTRASSPSPGGRVRCSGSLMCPRASRQLLISYLSGHCPGCAQQARCPGVREGPGQLQRAPRAVGARLRPPRCHLLPTPWRALWSGHQSQTAFSCGHGSAGAGTTLLQAQLECVRFLPGIGGWGSPEDDRAHPPDAVGALLRVCVWGGEGGGGR